MSFIDLTDNKAFTPISVGRHTFRIEDVEYNEPFGQLKIKMVTKDGKSHMQFFSFVKRDGTANDTARNIFSWFTRVAMNTNDIKSVDPKALIGKFIDCQVEHQEVQSKDDPSKNIIFTRISAFKNATGFETPELTTPATDDEMDALLG